MSRNLLTQMRNELRENSWLVIEMLVVFLAVWTMSYLSATRIRIYMEPMGLDATNVYKMAITENSDDSGEEETDEETAKAEYGASLMRLMENLRRNPHVEAAAFSANGLPYSTNSMNNQLFVFGKDTVEYLANFRNVSPEMVRVLRYESSNGVSPEQMEAFMKKGEILISDQPKALDNKGTAFLLGKTTKAGTWYGMDDYKDYMSHTLLVNVKRSEFDFANMGNVIKPIDESRVASGQESNVWEIAVRVRPGEEQAFLDDYEKDESLKSSGSVYLEYPESLMEARDIANRESLIMMRLMIGCSVFLIAIVFLGLIGSFWYRVRRRESEIAVRKVCGATAGDIFRRLVSEGMILLTLSAIIGLAFAFWYAFKNTHTFEGWKTDFIIGGVLAYLLMAIAVMGAVSVPAWKAMKVNAAEALKNE